MIVYLTFGEYYSGIYSSQVIDTCNRLHQITHKKILLIAFISFRNFLSERNKIKSNYKFSVIIPSVPKHRNFKFNIVLLFFLFAFKKREIIICRNAIPCYLGLWLKKMNFVKKVILDARAAEYEQFVEYSLSKDKKFIEKFFMIEKTSILLSDFRIAVSNKLVEYWNMKFNYNGKNHVIIPSTLNSIYLKAPDKNISRKDMGFDEDDVILVYSGSSAGWQSFSTMISFFEMYLQRNNKMKILLLTKRTEAVNNLVKKYTQRIKCFWSSEKEVLAYLRIADYGIIIREPSITNQVSSPVKFAEYLNAGLKVIVSKTIGDLGEFVTQNECGYIYDQEYIELNLLNDEQRKRNKELASRFFLKTGDEITNKYLKLLN